MLLIGMFIGAIIGFFACAFFAGSKSPKLISRFDAAREEEVGERRKDLGANFNPLPAPGPRPTPPPPFAPARARRRRGDCTCRDDIR